MIHNCPFITKDLVIDDRIYGPAKPLLQGSMKHHSKSAVEVPIFPLPAEILLHCKYIKLYIDLFYINGMPFLHTKSSKITLLAVETLSSRSADKIILELHTYSNMHTLRGFNINIYHRDNEFNINALR